MVSRGKWRHLESDFGGHLQQLDDASFDRDNELLGEGGQSLWKY
jgi:hypothetical protein